MVKSASEITRLVADADAAAAIGSSIHQLWEKISQQLGFIVTQDGSQLAMQTESTVELALFVRLTQHDA